MLGVISLLVIPSKSSTSVQHCNYSLCNTKATSKQALLLHADGKKHRGKARAFQAAKQQPKQSEESALDSNGPTKVALIENKHVEEQKLQDTPRVDSADTNTEIENGKLPSKRKRKVDASGSDGTGNKTKDGAANEVGNGKSQVERRKSDDVETQLKKAKHNALKDDKATSPKKEDNKKNIKWRKLIKSALKSVCILDHIFPCISSSIVFQFTTSC